MTHSPPVIYTLHGGCNVASGQQSAVPGGKPGTGLTGCPSNPTGKVNNQLVAHGQFEWPLQSTVQPVTSHDDNSLMTAYNVVIKQCDWPIPFGSLTWARNGRPVSSSIDIGHPS
ncbi:hypothetical protein PGTUg99_029027 [Puccinia graminis f. sp. tritici]|uniref:Uncharacterized protein n=1 Tax=Puccinia graminis f. sp. tritici TaxID=56615 RepID=A0A5B0LXC9_PUCGR|nr:hypothetical protein PGTUg99_029027 [Puccinia graminis f. sp. tritici]